MISCAFLLLFSISVKSVEGLWLWSPEKKGNPKLVTWLYFSIQSMFIALRAFEVHHEDWIRKNNEFWPKKDFLCRNSKCWWLARPVCVMYSFWSKYMSIPQRCNWQHMLYHWLVSGNTFIQTWCCNELRKRPREKKIGLNFEWFVRSLKNCCFWKKCERPENSNFGWSFLGHFCLNSLLKTCLPYRC